MLKNAFVFVLSCFLAGFATDVLAAKGGGSPGGGAASHMSQSGLANTNGPASMDRDKGLDRASDRMSTSGASHGVVQQKQGQRKGKTAK
ncbi:hypothetical protein [uncultured Propionivibrio sp.]|uniref:hypothetical protein n=1 Tax=uncultured Propionivibrio sp. TaxID=426737 RepID=UPI0029C0FDA6|nr:hypothetical protein [uncultured Propionivibrio sp.]